MTNLEQSTACMVSTKITNNQEGPATHTINGSLQTGQPERRQAQGPG